MPDVEVYDDLVAKRNVAAHEATMQQRAAGLLPSRIPRVIAYDAASGLLTMSRVRGDSLANEYGEACSEMPEELWDECRRLVMRLYDGGIVYPDITGYNFMVEAGTDVIWIIDFEHCTTREPGPFTPGEPAAEGEHWFVREFISGDAGNKWNADFA